MPEIEREPASLLSFVNDFVGTHWLTLSGGEIAASLSDRFHNALASTFRQTSAQNGNELRLVFGGKLFGNI
jgi:hypothetical protein